MKLKKSKRGRKPKPVSELVGKVKVEEGSATDCSFVKDARWTFKEDIILVKMYKLYPKNWTKISQEMMLRSPGQCSIRYNWLLKNNKIKLIERAIQNKEELISKVEEEL